MASGELSFKPALMIRKEACRVINKGETLYTQVAGKVELRKSLLVKNLKEDLNVEYRTNEIIVSNGGKQVIFNALQSTINKGDEVIIISPYWVSYPEIIKICGGKPKVLYKKRGGFFDRYTKLEKLITSKTKWLILNSPNNPTGIVYSFENLKKVVNLLMKYPNIWILSDDIYEKINFLIGREYKHC